MRCFFEKYKKAGYSEKYEENRYKRKAYRDLMKINKE